MFSVEPHHIGRFCSHRLINQDTGEYAEILTEFGAGINDLVVLNKSGDLISVIDGYRSESEVMNLHHIRFKGCKLSPFPNRIPGGKYSFNDVAYQLPINEVANNNHLHALLHFRPFALVDSQSSEVDAKLTLEYNYKGTEQGYPFPYIIRITYTFTKGELSIDTNIENTHHDSLPLGDGWHPYFKFDHGLDNIELQMDSAKRIFSLSGNVLSDSHGFETRKAIGAAKFDDCFEVTSVEDIFKLSLIDNVNRTTLEVWQESKSGRYKYLQIYTPESRKEIAVESVSCPPNAFNTKEGLIVLKAGEQTNMAMGVRFSTI